MMRWALVGRPETDRGIGIQTREIAQHLKPDWTLLVDLNSGFNKDFATFVDNPMTVMAREEGRERLDIHGIERMLRTHEIEVLLTVETFYDERVVPLCRKLGIKTIVQMNPEFYRGSREAPDEWWWPTPWLTHRLPIGKLMPVPVPWLRERVTASDTPLNVLHVAGKRAVNDRNGTRLFIESLRHLRSPIRVMIASQDHHDRWRKMIEEFSPNRGDVQVFHQTASTLDRRALYMGQDLLVMPRRFGGLCLPVLEAAGSGMAVAMTACSPNEWWPVFPMDCDRDIAVQVPFGNIPTMTVQPETIAHTIEMFARDRRVLQAKQEETQSWARMNTWDAWGPKYLERMEEVVG
jgi:hypothetical protein